MGEDADLFVYIHELSTDNPNALQLPWRGIRRQAEENDGSWQGGKYPYSFDGPDMWKHFSVPEGLHRVSFYWYNKDGHSGENRMRDHRVELFSAKLTPAECLTHEPLATARLWSGWNGEYVSFAVRGPAEYRIRMARDRSKGTILQAVFFDRLGSIQPKPSWLPDGLQMPTVPQPGPANEGNVALSLWQSCDRAETRGVPCPVERTLALRTAKASGAPEELLAAWRVQAGLWDEAGTDRTHLAIKPAN